MKTSSRALLAVLLLSATPAQAQRTGGDGSGTGLTTDGGGDGGPRVDLRLDVAELRIAEEAEAVEGRQAVEADALRARHVDEAETLRADHVDDLRALTAWLVGEVTTARGLRGRLQAVRAFGREVRAVNRGFRDAHFDLRVRQTDEVTRQTTRHDAERDAQAQRADWLRTHGVPLLPTVRAEATPVLAERPGADGHRRFFELAFAPVDDAPVEPVPVAAPAHLAPRLFDTCDADRYFVHFPRVAFAAAPVVDPAQLTALEDALHDRAEGWWFEGPAALRGRVPVRDAAAPHVVRALRAAVAEVFDEATAASARIGRVCTFAPQAAQEQPCDPADPPPVFDPAAADWHLAQMGFPGAADLPVGGAVQVALLDSGVDLGAVPGVIEHVGAGLAPEAIDGADRVHGTHMAALIRGALPQGAVALHSYRVFGANGTSTHHWLAAALERALFAEDGDPTAPLVVNLSLGWPPELSQTRHLEVLGTGPVGHVAELEEGVGEAVRAILDEALALDASGARRVTVLAASGNRPAEDAFAAQHRADLGAPPNYDDFCLDQIAFSYQWFFPAEWAATPTCDADGEGAPDGDRRVVWSVGGVDSRGRPAYLASAGDGREPPLTAPAELVVADTDDAPVTPVPLPEAISGTSAATALTTATVAYAQLLCTSGAAPGCVDGLSRPMLSNLIYVTGHDLGRLGRQVLTGSAAPRVTNACRLEQALACAEADVLGCLDAWAYPGSEGKLQNVALAQCGALVEACAADCGGFAPAEAPAWTDAYASWFECVGAQHLPAPAQGGLCAASPCPYELVDVDGVPTPLVDADSVGDVGPQPGVVGCPTCFAHIDPNAPAMSASLNLNPQLGGVTFEKATLIAYHADGSKAWFPVSLGEVSTWEAGDKITLKNMMFQSAPADGFAGTKVVLHLQLKPPKGASYANQSVLTVDLQ